MRTLIGTVAPVSNPSGRSPNVTPRRMPAGTPHWGQTQLSQLPRTTPSGEPVKAVSGPTAREVWIRIVVYALLAALVAATLYATV